MRVRIQIKRAAADKGMPWLPELEYPVRPCPQVAVLGVTMRGYAALDEAEGAVMSFPVWSVAALERSGAEALAGNWEEFLEVMRLRRSGHLRLERLEYPLVLFTSPERLMDERQAEILWREFGLPVFEQVRDADGRLVAWECVAREGLHMREGAGLRGRRAEGMCGCGETGVRIMREEGLVWAASG
jgi:hypothetical protein